MPVLGAGAAIHLLFAVSSGGGAAAAAAAAYNNNVVWSIRNNSSSSSRRRSSCVSCRYEKTAIKARAATSASSEEELRIVTSVKSQYNDIVIVDTPTSRLLLLDSTHNVHSIFNNNKEDSLNKWTDSYWDEFASLPPIVPPGPIALLGLGGGTSAHLMLHSWPSLSLHGWEIDNILIDKSREHLGLSKLEKYTKSGGLLSVHIGDALSPSASIPGGFAGIVVDLFADGKVLPHLQEVTTWREINNKLMSNGRIMVNCGGADTKTTEFRDRTNHNSSISNDDTWVQNSTIKALCNVFPGNLSWKRVGGDGENYLALTGPFPDVNEWSAVVPEKLSANVKQWRPCYISG